jgi:RNA polymerase sigma-70 factor (ECF subfamily)
LLSLKKHKAIKQAYETYYTYLFCVAKKKVGDVQTAEDMCQEVFIAFSEKIDQVTNVKTWLLGALRFQVVNYFRGKQAKYSNTDDIDIHQESLVEKDKHLDINIILNEIFEKESDLHKQVFELKNIHGWTLTSIAEELNMKRHKVKYIYEKVAKSLLEQLKKKGISTFGDIL